MHVDRSALPGTSCLIYLSPHNSFLNTINSCIVYKQNEQNIVLTWALDKHGVVCVEGVALAHVSEDLLEVGRRALLAFPEALLNEHARLMGPVLVQGWHRGAFCRLCRHQHWVVTWSNIRFKMTNKCIQNSMLKHDVLINHETWSFNFTQWILPLYSM